MKARKTFLSAASKRLYLVPIVLGLTVLLWSHALAQTTESMIGGPPTPLIAIPEDSFFRVVPSFERVVLLAQLSTFSINYLSDGTNVFGDTCIPWPTEARNAFDYAAGIWATYLQSSVPITINACWATNLPSGVLGHSGAKDFFRDFSGAPTANTWYPVSLANALSRFDLAPGEADMEMAYSTTFNWYFRTDGNPGPGRYDFVSVAMHEITHGLGFAGSMRVQSGQGNWGWGTSFPIAYDRFTENGSGQSLIDTGLFWNPSVALGSQLTGNNLYFDGLKATAANGGNRPKLYAPDTWYQGSSYSHLDEVYNGTVNALMTYSLSSAEAVHDPGPITLGILKDVGWNASSGEACQQCMGDLITHFYDTVLGRPPEAGAVDAWLNGYFNYSLNLDIDVRFIPVEMGRVFFLSPEYQSRNRTDAEFITDCYRAFLHRDPSAEELNAWLSGAWNRAEAMTMFANSAEFAAYIANLFPGFNGLPTRNFVTTMYIGLLDRLVDGPGLLYWSDLFDNSADKLATAKYMAQVVIDSPEFQGKVKTNEDLVIRLYRAFLGRFPNDGEVTYWAGELTIGTRTLAQVIDFFAHSDEFTQIMNKYF